MATAIKINPKISPYAGQEAGITVAATLSSGRRILALRTCGGVVATAFDRSDGLRRHAAKRLLQLTSDVN